MFRRPSVFLPGDEMAEVIPKMPAKGGKKYPWAEWLDGQPRMLTKGKDYHCGDASMAAIARLAGLRKGIRVEASYNTERHVVYVQAMLDDAASPDDSA